jgi:hypothetical protein
MATEIFQVCFVDGNAWESTLHTYDVYSDHEKHGRM